MSDGAIVLEKETSDYRKLIGKIGSSSSPRPLHPDYKALLVEIAETLPVRYKQEFIRERKSEDRKAPIWRALTAREKRCMTERVVNERIPFDAQSLLQLALLEPRLLQVQFEGVAEQSESAASILRRAIVDDVLKHLEEVSHALGADKFENITCKDLLERFEPIVEHLKKAVVPSAYLPLMFAMESFKALPTDESFTALSNAIQKASKLLRDRFRLDDMRQCIEIRDYLIDAGVYRKV